MSRFTEMRTFVAVVDEGSFSAAARALAVSKGSVSKQVARLEERLGAQLLQRTSRQMSLTDAGRVFYDRARRVLDELDDAEQAVNALQSEPRGRVRLSLPLSFGLAHLVEGVVDFLREHREVEVDVTLTDRRVDLIDEGYDLVVRIGELADSSLIARKLAPAEQVVVASPAYLAEHGEVGSPRELEGHECLRYRYQAGGTGWRFTPGGGGRGGGASAPGPVSVNVSGRFCANNGDALLEAARRDLGIALLPDFIVADDLAAGTLVRLLDDWAAWTGAAVWALFPGHRHLGAAVRALIDHLAEHLADRPR